MARSSAVPTVPVPVAEPEPASAPDRAPRFVVVAGRGGMGKTLLVRWLCERAHAAGRPVVIADGDRTNRSLPAYFDDVQAPPSADDHVVQRWLETIIEQMVVQRFDVVVDLGGGDMVLKQLAAEVDLQALLESLGVHPVMLHLLGPELESLGYLASTEAAGPAALDGRPLFAPARTALVLNEGLVPVRIEPVKAFEPIREHKVFRAALRREAAAVVMPCLDPALHINRAHLGFEAARHAKGPDGRPVLGPVDRSRLEGWLRRMEQNFAPIAEWLP